MKIITAKANRIFCGFRTFIAEYCNLESDPLILRSQVRSETVTPNPTSRNFQNGLQISPRSSKVYISRSDRKGNVVT